MVGVEQHHEGPIHDPLAFPIGLFDGIAREAQPEALDEAVELIFLRHFSSIRPEPKEIFDAGAMDEPALKKTAAAKDRVLLA